MRIECPHCKKQLQFPDEQRGQVVNCTYCGGQMQLPMPSGAHSPPPPPPSNAPPTPQRKPREGGGMPLDGGVDAAVSATKACRFCGEEIRAVATKCRHCGSYLTGPQSGIQAQRGAGGYSAAPENTTLPILTLVFGLLGLIVCAVFGPVALITGYVALKRGTSSTYRTLTIIGMVIGGLSTLIMVIMMIAFIAMAASGGPGGGGF
jgi:hypothetical protein